MNDTTRFPQSNKSFAAPTLFGIHKGPETLSKHEEYPLPGCQFDHRQPLEST